MSKFYSALKYDSFERRANDFIDVVLSDIKIELSRLLEEVWDEAYSEGASDGESDGFDRGREAGYQEGLADGKQND